MNARKTIAKKAKVNPLQKKVAVKKLSNFRPQIRSRHDTHDPLREELPLFPFRSVIRLGSQTELPDTIENGGRRIEINTTEACGISADKQLMKEAFTDHNVKTAEWVPGDEPIDVAWLKDGGHIIVKPRFGSRGSGLRLLSSTKDLEAWGKGRDLSNYIVEKYYNYVREYRLHVNEDGCFYTCRKMLKNDTPKDKRFYRNDSNSNWISETNPMFDKPSNWNAIVAESVKALKAVGLDFGACDVRVQSSKDSKGKDRKDPKFFIVEINSAPSFGEITLERYLDILPSMLRKKFKESKNL